MNHYWHGNYDDGVLVMAMDGVQVASVARVDGKAVPGAMTEIAFSTDPGMLQVVQDRTFAVTTELGEPDLRVNRFIRAYGWSDRDENGKRRFMDRGAFVKPTDDPNEIADRLMLELADLLRKTP
jgi:hypothetical protein